MKRRGMWWVLAMLLWLGSGWAGAQETAQTARPRRAAARRPPARPRSGGPIRWS